jgi:RNA polymerase sigma factor (sigma-70 family)
MISETARQRFTEQVLPHLDDAYTLARWLTGNPTDAEDVVQDACMRALRALDGAPVEHPRAWLLAIIRNTAFTWLAKNRPHAVVLAGGAEEAHAHQGALEEQAAPTPEEALIAKAARVSFRPDRSQVLGNQRSDFEHPPADRLIADSQATLCQEIFDIPVA